MRTSPSSCPRRRSRCPRRRTSSRCPPRPRRSTTRRSGASCAYSRTRLHAGRRVRPRGHPLAAARAAELHGVPDRARSPLALAFVTATGQAAPQTSRSAAVPRAEVCSRPCEARREGRRLGERRCRRRVPRAPGAEPPPSARASLRSRARRRRGGARRRRSRPEVRPLVARAIHRELALDAEPVVTLFGRATLAVSPKRSGMPERTPA